MKKLRNRILLLIILLGNILNISPIIYAEGNTEDATQFINSVTLSNNDGPIGTNKISDSSSVNVTYNMGIPEGVTIDTSQPYTMPLPVELKYQTTTPIQLKKADGTLLGQVTIQNNIISIVFEATINTLSNRTLFFNFWSGFNKDTLNYDNGNDLLFPIKDNPSNTAHVNFSKSNSGGGSGASAVSKTLRYGEDNTITWTITINNGGYSVGNANFVDTMENTQNYIPGSTTINFRNYKNNIINSSNEDLNFITNSDGTQSVSKNFGRLFSDDEAVETETTSIVIRYQSKMIYNSLNNKYPNRAYSYDEDSLIDSAVSTATYRGQGGGGDGDVAGDVTVKYMDEKGNKISEDVVKPGNIGDKYTTEQKDIAGYTFKEVQGNPIGQFTDSPQTVTYVYTKNPVKAADVIAKYVDTAGNKISDDVVKSGNIGDKYTTELKDIEGYTFKEMGKDSAAVSGDFTDKAQTVTYVYTKNPVAAANVTAKYVDTEGNTISDDVVNSGNIGDKYTTEPKDIEGYTFKEMGKDSAAVSGNFTDKAQAVIYVYTKDKVNPVTPTPADNKPSHKEDTHKSVPSSSTHSTLPETGENERMTLMSVGTGLILLMVALITSIFRFKRFKNNK